MSFTFKSLIVFSMLFSANGFAYDCNSDCTAESRVCRKIWGKEVCTPPEPTIFTACSIQKAASCKNWEKEENFAVCMGFPNREEAAFCSGAAVTCFVTVLGGPVPYGVCLGAACGAAGAAHAYRCAEALVN